MTKGKHFKSRFIQPGLAGYPGQFGNALIKKENLDRFVHTLRNKPVTINHRDKITEEDKKGEVFNVWFNPDDGWYWCDGIITDDEAINLINNGWSVSCAYDFTKADNSGGTENNIPYDIEFLDGEFNHLALVDNPRYEGANIVFNSKVVNFNPNHDEEGKFCESDNVAIKYKQYNDLENDYLEFIENEPEDYKFNNKEEIFKDLGIDENNPLLIETPIEDIKVTTKSIDHIAGGGGDGHPPDKTRYKSINKMLETLKKPMFVNEIDGKKVYFKIFKNNTDSKKDMVIIKQDNEVYTNFPVDRSSWFFKNLKQGKTIYDIKNKRRKSDISTAHVNNIIPHFRKDLNPNMNIHEVNNDKWITIKPNGEDNKGKHLLVKDGETPKEAIERTYKKNENQEEKNNDFDIKKHLEEVRKNHKNFSDETSDYLNDLKTNDKTAYKEVMALVKKYFTTVKYLDKKGLLGKKEEIDRIPDYLNSDLKYTPEGEKLREFAKKHGKTYGNLIKTIYELQKKKSQAQNSLTDTILNAIAELIIGE